MGCAVLVQRQYLDVVFTGYCWGDQGGGGTEVEEVEATEHDWDYRSSKLSRIGFSTFFSFCDHVPCVMVAYVP